MNKIAFDLLIAVLLWLGGEILFRRLRRYLRERMKTTKLRLADLRKARGASRRTPKKLHTVT